MNHAIVPCDTPERVEAACALLQGMYPQRTAESIRATVAATQAENWRLIGIFAEDGECLATICYRIGHRLFFNRYMQLDSLFVQPEARRQKLAEQLFDWLEAKAREEQCDHLILESTAENFGGHKFFFRQGYHIRGYVFNKAL